MRTKYIFVTGGVVSGLGKGITAASLGMLLKQRGYKVTIQKLDPYLNIDPGNMNPLQHGEAFVTDDGAVTDLDLGHYERFIDESLTANNSVSAGKIYWTVLSKERRREYDGKTIQVIPHITDAIKEKIYSLGAQSGADIVITEIGGTVGDMECLPFFEAIRQAAFEVSRQSALFIHLILLPRVGGSGEVKTKPSQHSVKELLGTGIKPDIIVCRTEQAISDDVRAKLELFCNVEKGCVVQNVDVSSVYEIPLRLEDENFAQIVLQKLGLENREPELSEWRGFVDKEKSVTKHITVGLVGKYIGEPDSYLSVVESLRHAGVHNDAKVSVKLIDASELEKDISPLHDINAIVVPSGFGERGVLGKIQATKYARENKIPYFGIGLGMQCAVIEYARNIAGITEAASTELVKNGTHNVIDVLPENKDEYTNGSEPKMRLGTHACKLKPATHAEKAYGKDLIYERHRHRYEFNHAFKQILEDTGLVIAGLSPDERLVEIIELSESEHPFFIGVQFQPEFKSRPNKPHPLFDAFVRAALG